mgnify:CR=1 FL=1
MNKLLNSAVFARSLIPSSIVAKLTGKYKINVYFKAVSLFNLHNKHATKTVPLLLIPGTIVIIWNKPIIIASFIVISSSFLSPFMFLTINKDNAVIKKAKARPFIE